MIALAGGCASQGVSVPGTTTGAAGDNRGLIVSGSSGLVATASRLKHALLRFYQRWAGTPYRYGGQSKQGVDCSSFVRKTIDATESYELPRTATQQARMGMAIPRADLKVGDLVFFKTGIQSHHVGIYLGHGRFMHASSSQGVTISRLNNIYWRTHYWQSRRIADTDSHGRATRL